MRILLIALLAAISYAQTEQKEVGEASRLMESFAKDEMKEMSIAQFPQNGAQDERPLTADELANIYKIVADEFRKEGMEEAAQRTVRAWAELSAELSAQSSAERRRLLKGHSMRGGKKKACKGKSNPKKCMQSFDEIVKNLIEHEGNQATKVCSKPENKRGGSLANCCGESQYLGWCWGKSGWSTMSCCGATLISNGYCYADHGSHSGIVNHDVCPPDKWSCARFGVGTANYCAASTYDCANEVYKAYTAIAELIANALSMVFSGGASAAAKVAVSAGKNALKNVAKGVARTTVMASIKVALKNAGKELLWKTLKKNLKKHFKKVPGELGDLLMEEVLAIHSVQDAKDTFTSSDLAWSVGEIVDPTGIVAFVHFLKDVPDGCKYPSGPTSEAIDELLSATDSHKSGCNPSWKSTTGHSCQNYANEGWCTPTGGYGKNWKTDWGSFDDWAVHGLSALDACTQCGCSSESITEQEYEAEYQAEEMRALEGMEADSVFTADLFQYYAVQLFALVGILSLIYYASKCTKSALLVDQRNYDSIKNPEEC